MNENRRELLLTLGLAAAVPLALPARAAPEVPAAPTRKLGLALVGLGSYATGQVAPGLEQSEHWKVAGIVTGSPSKAPAWKQKWGLRDEDVFSYDDFDRIASRPDIDAVYICLPNALHAPFTLRAARAGKHVIVEKPMAVSVAEAEQMVAACDAAGVKLAVGYRLRFNAHHQQVAAWGRDRTHGKVQYVHAAFSINVGNPGQWRLKKALAGGGALMDVGIYAVQAARYSTGEEPIAVTAQWVPATDPAKFAEVEEGLSFQLRFPSGAFMTGYCGYKNYVDELHVATTQKDYRLEPAFAYGPLKGDLREGTRRPLDFPHVQHQRAQMEGLAPLFRSAAPLPDAISGREGLRDVRILMAIYEAARSGREVALTV